MCDRNDGVLELEPLELADASAETCGDIGPGGEQAAVPYKRVPGV